MLRNMVILSLIILTFTGCQPTSTPFNTLTLSANSSQTSLTHTVIPSTPVFQTPTFTPSTPVFQTPTVTRPHPTQNPLFPFDPLTAFQKGVSFTAWEKGVYSLPDTKWVLENQIRPLGATWISLVVQCYQETRTSTEIDCQSEWVPADDELLLVVQIAHANGLRVMLKPSLDLSNDPDHWRGEIDFGTSETGWRDWFTAYSKFITHYAQLAQDWGVDQFCVGTELYDNSIGGPATRTQEWRKTISQVREIYKGPLVYAANWGGEEQTIQFWDSLDYIGIDAYYILSQAAHPSVAQLIEGWQAPLAIIEQLAKTWNKQILFTEIGYRSIEGAPSKPWEDGTLMPVDLQTQANAYEAVFKVFGQKNWWHGAFWWQWSPNVGQGGPLDISFTPQNKPAEDVLRFYYGTLPRPTPTPINSKPVRILFDEAHSESNTISLEYAKKIDPLHPDFRNFGMLVESLGDAYVFERNVNSSLTSILLKDYDVLMFSAPTNLLTTEEKDALNEFVQNGGGLVVLGDCGLGDPVNQLTSPYDITFQRPCVFISDREGEFHIRTFANHPVTANQRFVMNWGQSLTVQGSAVALAFTDDKVFKDTNWNSIHDPGEAYGPFAVIAVNEIGSARIVAVADNSFQDDGFPFRSNNILMQSILAWAAHRY